MVLTRGETVKFSLVVIVSLLVNYVDTSQLSVLREARNGDIFFGIRPCGPKAKALNGSGCQCEYPHSTFYEGKSGTYCSQLWSNSVKDTTIISNEECEDGNIDENGDVVLSCTPSFKEHSMSAEIRNKDKLRKAYWDKGFNEYIINSTMSFDEETMTIDNSKGYLSGLLIKFNYHCKNTNKKKCSVIKLYGVQLYPYIWHGPKIKTTTAAPETTKPLIAVTTPPTKTTTGDDTTRNETLIPKAGVKDDDDDSDPVPIIVGILIAIIIILVIVIFICCKRRRSKKRAEATNSDVAEAHDPQYTSPHPPKIDRNKNSIKGKTLPDASPYQALQHKNDPSQYRSLGEYNNEGYTHLNTDHQPVYGKLEREPELYEATNGTVQQPIYKELNHSQPEYREVGNEQPEYGEVDKSQPVYKELNIQDPQYSDPRFHKPEYGELFQAPEYGELDVSPPEYRELDHQAITQDQEPIYKELDNQMPEHVELDNLEPVYRELEPEDEDSENIYANNTNSTKTVPQNKPKPLTKPNPKPKPTPRSEKQEAKKPTTNEQVNVKIYFSNPVVPSLTENRADVNQLYTPVVKN